MANQLTKYAQDGVYPDGTLLYVIKTVAVTLRSFTSRIPARKVNLTLKVGYFGPPFEEVFSQLTHFVDFSRFLLEHLPLIYNNFISLGAFFETMERSTSFCLNMSSKILKPILKKDRT